MPRIKKPESLTMEQRLEAARLLRAGADQMQEDLDSMTKPKLGKNGEVIQEGKILTPIEIRRLRQDIIDCRLEAIALEGSAQENDLSNLRRALASLRRRNEQLEQLVKMHGLALPGYEEWTAPVVASVAEVGADAGAEAAAEVAVKVAAPDVVDAAKVERAKRPRGKAGVAMVSAGPAAVVKGGDVYEPRHR